jgi:hypothetical protein
MSDFDARGAAWGLIVTIGSVGLLVMGILKNDILPLVFGSILTGGIVITLLIVGITKIYESTQGRTPDPITLIALPQGSTPVPVTLIQSKRPTKNERRSRKPRKNK